MYRALLVMLLLAVSASGQQSECSKAQLRASMAEARLAAERARAASLTTLRFELEQEIAALKEELGKRAGQAAAAEQRASAEREKLSSAAHKRIAGLEKDLSQRDEAIGKVTQELETTKLEAKRARSWKASLARVFGIKLK